MFGENIVRLKFSTRLNYHKNVTCITIKDDHLPKPLDVKFGIKRNSVGEIVINDSDDIKRIIDYLNSLRLIEDNPTEYEDIDIDAVGYFTILIIRDNDENGDNGDNGYDVIDFETNYLTFAPNGYDSSATRYYIKNSGYNSKTQSSNTYKFLRNLLTAGA